METNFGEILTDSQLVLLYSYISVQKLYLMFYQLTSPVSVSQNKDF